MLAAGLRRSFSQTRAALARSSRLVGPIWEFPEIGDPNIVP